MDRRATRDAHAFRRVHRVHQARTAIRLAGILCLCAGPLRAQALPIDSVLAARELLGHLAPIRVSPDGGYVAFTVCDPRRRPSTLDQEVMFTANGAPMMLAGCAVAIASTAASRLIKPGGDSATSWGGAWSPDGQRLAFYSDEGGTVRLWIWNRRTASRRVASQAAVHVFYPFELPEWSPDGKSIIAKLRPRSGGEAPAEPVASREARDTLPTVIVLSSRGDSTSNAKSLQPGELIAQRYLSDLAAIDVGTGAVRRLTHRLLVLRYWVSPDGRHLAFTTLRGTRSLTSEQTLYDLHVVSLRSGRSRIAAGRIPQVFGSGVSWSPDGSLLAFTADPVSSDSSRSDTAGGCFVVAPDTGAPRRITDGVPRRVASVFQPPLWDSTGRYLYLVANDTLFRLSADGGDVRAFPTPPGVQIEFILSSSKSSSYWSPDGADSLYLALLDTTTLSAALARVDLSTGAVVVRPFADQLAPLGVWQQDGVGNALAYVGESAARPADIWMRNVETNTTRRVTRLNPALDRVRYGGAKLVSWRSSDGLPLRGALLLPPSYRPGTHVPLVVYVYGGSRLSSRISSFGGGLSGGDNLQILATRGFAVLLPDAPLRVGTPMADLAKTVLPGVDRVIDLGIADPDRVGVMGASYGGYSVLALLTQTTRFRAAVSIAGFSDLIAAYGQLTPDGSAEYISFAESGQGRMGGSPWAYRDRFIENSPLFYLDRVETPVLLIHGTDDTAVPVVLGNETYAALTRLGKDVVYVKYRGEGHTIRSFANARDYARRVVDWFDTYLRPGTSTGAVGSH